MKPVLALEQVENLSPTIDYHRETPLYYSSIFCVPFQQLFFESENNLQIRDKFCFCIKLPFFLCVCLRKKSSFIRKGGQNWVWFSKMQKVTLSLKYSSSEFIMMQSNILSLLLSKSTVNNPTDVFPQYECFICQYMHFN